MKVTVGGYKKDKYYPAVTQAVRAILQKADVVTPIDVFLEMGNLTKSNVEDWRFGRIPFLERVVLGNLSKVGRILRILAFHVHDLDMIPSQHTYRKWGKGRKINLRFSKSGDAGVEGAWSRHYHRKRRKSPEESPSQAGEGAERGG